MRSVEELRAFLRGQVIVDVQPCELTSPAGCTMCRSIVLHLRSNDSLRLPLDGMIYVSAPPPEPEPVFHGDPPEGD